VSVYSDTAIEITWERIQRSTFSGITGYEIYRNGELHALVEGNSYFDDTLVPGIDYNYSVSAVSGGGSRSDLSEAVSVNTGERDGDSPGAGTDYVVPSRLSQPTSVDVFVYSANSIELVWNRPIDDDVIGYEIRRNNNYIGFTRGVSFFDDTVSADNCYRYNILPVDSDGHLLGLINAVAATGTVAGCK